MYNFNFSCLYEFFKLIKYFLAIKFFKRNPIIKSFHLFITVNSISLNLIYNNL